MNGPVKLALLLALFATHLRCQEDRLSYTVPAIVTAINSTSMCPSQAENGQNQITQSVASLLSLGHSEENPATSCGVLLPSINTNGLYWIQTDPSQPAIQLYCDFSRRCGCNDNDPSKSAWTRVAFLNMSDPSHECPSGWTLVPSPARSCTGRGISTTFECNSAFFPTHRLSYSRVCGQLIGYQDGTPDGLRELILRTAGVNTIEASYVDGVSLTHGRAGSRQHIWTFVGARGDGAEIDDENNLATVCACSTSNSWPYSTDFVGENYFCDTADHDSVITNLDEGFFTNDPLWDGAGCSATSSCCEFNRPPWFCRTLPQPTTDDLEVRICHASGNEDTPVQLVELYVQ